MDKKVVASILLMLGLTAIALATHFEQTNNIAALLEIITRIAKTGQP